MNQTDTLKNAIFQAADHRSTPTMSALHQILQKHYTKDLNGDVWFISTDDCHLCQTALIDYQVVARITSCPPAHVIDVLDFDETMSAVLAPFVPILITPQGLLAYPFGVLDIIQLHSL